MSNYLTIKFITGSSLLVRMYLCSEWGNSVMKYYVAIMIWGCRYYIVNFKQFKRDESLKACLPLRVCEFLLELPNANN